mgnify:CR=1 FL=1
MIRSMYVFACAAALILFAAHGFFGVNLFTGGDRSELPDNIRSQPGGYRSFIFWNSGYQGGK